METEVVATSTGQTANPTPAGFETQVCGRCLGSGTYSRCQRWGTTCFACGVTPNVPGPGIVLTKRGAVARKFYRGLLPTKRVGDLVVGDKFNDRGRRTVVEISEPFDWSYTSNGEVKTLTVRNVQTKNMGYPCKGVDETVQMLPTVEQRDAAMAAALAYQDTLTKTGTVRKRATRR